MAKVESLTLRYERQSSEAAKRSFASLFAISGASFDGLADCLSGLFCEEFVAGDELRDLLGSEAVNRAAPGASKLDGLKIEPCDTYLVLFAALARHANKDRIRISHGWPHLESE